MSAILCRCVHLQPEIQKVKLIIIQVQSFGGFCIATMKGMCKLAIHYLYLTYKSIIHFMKIAEDIPWKFEHLFPCFTFMSGIYIKLNFSV